MWWLNKGKSKVEEIPEAVFYASGFGGNYIVIDQQNKLVVVARWLEPSEFENFIQLIYKAIR